MQTHICKKCTLSFVGADEETDCPQCRVERLEAELERMTKDRDGERKRGDEATSLLMAKVSKLEAENKRLRNGIEETSKWMLVMHREACALQADLVKIVAEAKHAGK